MAKTEREVVKPVSVESVTFGDSREVNVPQGQAFVIPVINNVEVEEQAFFTSVSTADKYYNNANYVIKKKN